MYFKKEPKFKIKCFQNPHTGLEIKGEGGYVVCPPSIHASGKSYEWIVPPYEEMAEAPQWLLDYINTNANNKKHLQLNTNNIPLWHKENMINIGIRKLLPNNWKAVAWIDADIEFGANLVEASMALSVI